MEQEQCGCCQKLAILAAQQKAARDEAAAKEKAKADKAASKAKAEADKQARKAAREAKAETRAELARERFAVKAQRDYEAAHPELAAAAVAAVPAADAA
jgi:hypothetical protein